MSISGVPTPENDERAPKDASDNLSAELVFGVRVSANHHVDSGRGRKVHVTGLVARRLVRTAIVVSEGRGIADANVEVRIAAAGHLEAIGTRGEDGRLEAVVLVVMPSQAAGGGSSGSPPPPPGT